MVLSYLNPVPSIPKYTGPYGVGSVDIEVPTAELVGTNSGPDPSITTIAFRVFYPCEQTSRRTKAVRWLPDPQRSYFVSLAEYLSAGTGLAEALSYCMQHLYYISIPVQRNAPLLAPHTQTKRWPVVVFSHGLAGFRNAYSHLLGSLASHGIVVIATEHRDGSAPISVIQSTGTSPSRTIRSQRHPHTPSPPVYEARDAQLRIRLWELSLVYTALLKIDAGDHLTLLGCREGGSTASAFSGLAHALDIHDPGSISWAGHSFGAVTALQFVKSIYWRTPGPSPVGYKPLFTPTSGSPLIKQITPHSALILLDPWHLPLLSPSTAWLSDKPLPSYDGACETAPGGNVILAIISEAFFKWAENLNDIRRTLAPPTVGGEKSPKGFPRPRFFYPLNSAHLSQSDFGILFPWITRKLFGAMEPERVVRLNTRAILQMLREKDFDVADIKRVDSEEQKESESSTLNGDEADDAIEGRMRAGKGDWRILARDGTIRGWVYIGLKEGDDTKQEPISFTKELASGSDSEEARVEGELLDAIKA
ncbi:MAG: hypothetical protein M1820_008769 [Bogoriella megaspora]|nr:MAG: hypothetical protein M1820_008769 [Bogoriella megaspora]